MSKPISNGTSIIDFHMDIIDIRHGSVEKNLKEEVLQCLQQAGGNRQLSSTILYNETGLKLYEKITYLEEYYLTNAEIDIFQTWAQEISHIIISGSVIMELGSGNLRKVAILLQALEAAGKDIDYYALDLSWKELRRTLEEIPPFQHVRCHGLYGTYDDGLQWLRENGNMSRPTCVIFLGSSLGNLDHREASVFLKGFSDILKPSDSMLIGLDATCDPLKIYHAYNDREGITHKFILNGLQHANEIFGKQLFMLDDWKVIGEYVYDENGGRHQAFYSPIKDVYCEDTLIKADERIQVEKSFKFSPEEISRLWKNSELTEINRWTASAESYSLHFLQKENVSFNLNPASYATSALPTLEDWKTMWRVWDKITLGMVPRESLYEKPIKLRHPLIFYLGHIPTFLDIQMSKVIDDLSLERYSYFSKIFERGIDPDVDNPQICHEHSDVPHEWPPLEDILDYQCQVRAKLQTLYGSGKINREISRAIWVAFEHEAFHVETFLYMVLYLDSFIKPTAHTPDFEAEAKKAKALRVPNQWFQIPSQNITIGIDDPEDDTTSETLFGWDNEKPPRVVEVPAFQAKARPLTIEDYGNYLEQTQKSKLPISWVFREGLKEDGNRYSDDVNYKENRNGFHSMKNIENIFVRTFYGLIPMKFTLDWPVFASYDELAECARWMNARLPTFEEARSIYTYVDLQRSLEKEKGLNREISALHTNGIHETSGLSQSRTPAPQNIFSNLDKANVGLRNWHPVAVTGNGNILAGQSEMGGVWEWTSSPLRKYEGFKPMKLYPNFTADFFDEKHNIILGGSWAFHPRLSGRRSFINWFQRNYLYPWVGARLVRDL